MTIPPFDRRGFYLALARRLRVARAAKGMTQEALAHESGVNVSTISYAECAQQNTSLRTVLDLSEALGVHPRTLLFDPEE